MDIKAAEQLVVAWAKEYRHELGLQGSNIEASYIWNPGGFVNQSYRLSDGETIRHVKFVQERKTPHLQQWALLSDHLADRYHAPRLVQEVTQEVLPGYPYGLVFEFIDGMPLSAITDPTPMIPKVLRMLHQLHTDSQIRDVIASKHVLSYAEALAEEYITRFEEDLEGIRAERHLLTFEIGRAHV